jgi:large subunit ribosomal protein L16
MKKGKKPNKIAIFDIDGTIFRKNLHFELINELSWLKVFPNSVRRELSEVYSHWLEHSGTYEDYRKAIVRIYAEHIVGVSETSVREAARIVVPFHARRTYLFSEALLKQLRAEDYHLLAISGSPIEIVEEYNEHYLHFDRVFGSIYTKDEKGVYTGAAEFEPSLNKGEVLQQYVYEHGLKTLEYGRIRSNQIEAARKVISRALGKTGKTWIRIFPDMPYTAKPAEVKLGKGKGDLQGYQAPVKPGRVLFEVDGVSEAIAKEALRKAGTKLPVKTKVVAR